MIALSFLIAAILSGCGISGPTFVNVEEVIIQHISPDGLTKKKIEGRKEFAEVAECLYSSKQVEESHAQNRNLLQTTYLIEIKDAYGIRSFELFTDQHLKGNKGSYYHNTCLYKIITREKLPPRRGRR